VLVGGLHVLRGVIGGEHDLLDEIGEDVEVAGGGARRQSRRNEVFGGVAGADG